MKRLFPACIAEFIGTFGLVFFGAGSVILTHAAPTSGASLITIALCNAFIVAICVTAFIYISGAQFNPAVSIALVIAGKQRPAKALVFIFFQLIAAAAAAGMLQLFLSPEMANDAKVNLGATIGSMTLAGNLPGVFGIEAILTFFLMISILPGTVDDRAHKLGGFTIGLTVAACILAAGPLTGASMNPARTFGPAICGRHWNMFWVYCAAPTTGACTAALVYRRFFQPR